MVEDDTWAQTLITVTPEDDAVLRELSTSIVISAPPDTALVTDHVVYRRPLGSTHFPLPAQSSNLEDALDITKDAENQTCLQGVPSIRLPIECKDEASQTLYMSAPCPPLKYFRDIMTSMKDVPTPAQRKSIITGTIIRFHLDTSHDVVLEKLERNIQENDIIEFDSNPSQKEEADIIGRDVIHFILSRIFWIIDPASQKKAETNDAETQTALKFHFHFGILFMDSETQTALTCEPKKSNSNLLSNYEDTKKFLQSCLNDCFCKGIDSLMIANEITEGILEKCAATIKYPMKDQAMQTAASYKLRVQREEDVLRMLRLEIVVDPSEPFIVVPPLLSDLLKTVCDTVSDDASFVVKHILDCMVKRCVKILTRLMEIRMEAQAKSIDHVLDQRRKKILDSMSKKSTESVSTQTFLAGIHELTRIKEPKEVLCSVCKKKSECHWCYSESDFIPPEEAKPNRTQDILFAYKPCYILATPSESKKYPYLEHSCLPQNTMRPLPKALQKKFVDLRSESSESVNVVYKSVRKASSRDSSSGWSRVLDTALMKPWSISDCNASTCSKTFPPGEEHPVSGAHKALQVLKNTFCTRDTCNLSSGTSRQRETQPEDIFSDSIRSRCNTCCNVSEETEDTEESEENMVCPEWTAEQDAGTCLCHNEIYSMIQ